MTTFELARFTVDPARAEELLAARPAMADELKQHCPGFIQLWLLRLDERTWLDVVEWETREHADQALEIVQQHPGCQAMFELIEELVGMDHGEVVDRVVSVG